MLLILFYSLRESLCQVYFVILPVTFETFDRYHETYCKLCAVRDHSNFVQFLLLISKNMSMVDMQSCEMSMTLLLLNVQSCSFC